MLAGAAGLMWYSYWIEAKGYGAAGIKGQEGIDPKQLNQEQRKKLLGWISLMTFSNTLAVVGALLAALSFSDSWWRVAASRGLVPKESQVAETLGRLLGDLWGPLGFWFMVAIVFITFCSTTLSVEDGFGRMFADGTQIILQGFGVRGRWTNEKFLQRFLHSGASGSAAHCHLPVLWRTLSACCKQQEQLKLLTSPLSRD
jgi:hypothetical protein